MGDGATSDGECLNILFWEKTHQAELQVLELQNHSLSNQFQIRLVLEHRILKGAGTPSPRCGDVLSSLHVGLQKGLSLVDALCLLDSACLCLKYKTKLKSWDLAEDIWALV